MTDLIKRLKAGERGNELDVLIEVALFVADETAVSCRANGAGTKVIYTALDGAEKTCWAADWSIRPWSTIRTLEAASRIAELEATETRWIARFSDVRAASGIGVKPMLSEVPDAIRARFAELEANLATAVGALERIEVGKGEAAGHPKTYVGGFNAASAWAGNIAAEALASIQARTVADRIEGEG